MNLADQINEDIKTAMKGGEKDTLMALRDIKSKILLEATKDGVSEVMCELGVAAQNKSKVNLGEEVLGFERDGEWTQVKTNKASYKARYLIVCGGLQADRLAKKDGIDLKEKVVGFRGDYYELAEHAKHKVKHLIYPVPNPEFPFLGVHFTRMTDGSIECGPNAVFTSRQGLPSMIFS